MGTNILERLKEFLAQLPPQSQALLMREFERAIERGDDATVPNLVLGELRKIVRGADENTAPRTDDPARLMFAPLEPFLIDGTGSIRPGQIRRQSLSAIWMWLKREGEPAEVEAFEAVLRNPQTSAAELDRAVRKMQLVAADAIATATGGGGRDRPLGRIGTPSVVEDIPSIGAVLKVRDALETLGSRLAGQMRNFGEAQIASVTTAINIPSLQTPQTLPFALSLIMHRLLSPWQIIRFAISIAASDDEMRVAGTPYGVAVTMAIHDLSRLVSALRDDIRRGQFSGTATHLKTLHDSLRGLRTELDIRSDSNWGRQLSAIRAEISNTLQSEIDSVPGRVRRLLRQRPEKDITANSRLDETEIEETAALIDFVAICRNYASELAINEVTLRTYSDLQQYIEKATEALVASLRASDSRTRPFRSAQVQAAIRFCEVMFGPDYASLMQKAAEVAKTGERKPARAS
jgi:hypothetical protein